MILVSDVSLPLDGDLRAACARKLRLPVSDVEEVRLLRRSVDARRKSDVHFIVSAAVSLRHGEERFTAYVPWTPTLPEKLEREPKYRPIVCGAGPAGPAPHTTGRWAGFSFNTATWGGVQGT